MNEARLVDVSASSYTAGVLVVTGAPGAFQIVACGPRRIAFPVSAGTTYHLLIIDDQADGGGNGGTLVLTVDSAPPPPVLMATIDPTGVGSLDVRCNGSVNPWSVEVTPGGAGTKFSGGKAASLTFAVACGPLQCSVNFQEYDVRLSRQG